LDHDDVVSFRCSITIRTVPPSTLLPPPWFISSSGGDTTIL
jgi:hypothetical protein